MWSNAAAHPPARASRSSRHTSSPRAASRAAAVKPPMPPPTTTTSCWLIVRTGRALVQPRHERGEEAGRRLGALLRQREEVFVDEPRTLDAVEDEVDDEAGEHAP